MHAVVCAGLSQNMYYNNEIRQYKRIFPVSVAPEQRARQMKANTQGCITFWHKSHFYDRMNYPRVHSICIGGFLNALIGAKEGTEWQHLILDLKHAM